MKKLTFVLLILAITASCNDDPVSQKNLTGDFLNTYHLKGVIQYYTAGNLTETISLDEGKNPHFGSFAGVNSGGFVSSFSKNIDIYFGLVQSEKIDPLNVTIYEVPSEFNPDDYPIVPTNSFFKSEENFSSISMLIEGPDKNYNYSSLQGTSFELDSIYLSRESVFRTNTEIDDVCIFVGSFSTTLIPELVRPNPLLDIPDSIKLNVSSVKGFLR
ncbi:hypothetical protein [Ekhidna sp.]